MPMKSVGTFANRPTSPLAGDEYTVTDQRVKYTCYVAGTWVVETDEGAESSPTQITANQNDYAFAGGESSRAIQRVSSDAARNITGFAGGVNGRKLIFMHVGAFAITLQNQNAGSSAANRIITGTGADLAVAADQTVILVYDNTTQRWRIMKNA